MQGIRASILISFMALVMVPGASLAQSSGTAVTTAPVVLRADFHPGETVRYTFLHTMKLTTWLNSRLPSDKAPSLIPRQYQVEGEIVATFAPTQPGEPLRGTVQFQGLTVKDWVSSAKVADWEARLRQLEAAPMTLTTADDSNLELAAGPGDPIHDPFFVDAMALDYLAKSVLTSRISSEPLAPGQRRESTDFPVHGFIKPGAQATTLTEYITDVPIGRHPSAEVRLSVNVPTQSFPMPIELKAAKILGRGLVAGAWTYLLDLDSHQISFLHETSRTESSASVESTDPDDPVRIPVKMFTVNMEDEQTARRVEASASPEREADLAAFERSLQAPSHAASQDAGAIVAASTDGEVSLGDFARRQRAQRAAQGPPQAETALQGVAPAAQAPPQAGTAPQSSAPAVEGVAAGFKKQAFPDGDMTVLVPAEASHFQGTGNSVNLRASLGTPPTIVLISIAEVSVGQADSSDNMLDEFAKGVQDSTKAQVLQNEKKTINGMNAEVMELQFDAKGVPFQGLTAIITLGGKGFSATCGTLSTDFPRVESACRTVVESMSAR